MSTNTSTEFFDFSDEHDDEAFEHMHHQEKVSAKQFMQTHTINSAKLKAATHALRDLNEYCTTHEVLNEACIKNYTQHIEVLHTFVLSVEAFDDMVATLKTLLQVLHDNQIAHINDESKNLIRAVLVAIAQDLFTWLDTVFVQLSTQDIYYFDASFTSSVMQLSSLLGKENS